MTDFEQKLEQYAEMAVKLGVNIQPGQPLLIRTSIDAAPLVRLVTKKAFEHGASDVYVEWADEETSKLKLLHAPTETLQKFPLWKAKGYEEMAENGVASLVILTPKPDILTDVDPDRIAMQNKARRTAMKKYNDFVSGSKIAWSIVAYVNEEWATSVFPGLPVDEAVEKLWSYVFYTTRMDAVDPIAAWKEHVAALQERLKYLNEERFVRLHYKAPGTDLTIDLPDEHIWLGGGEKTPAGVYFMPNMPTEEVFTLPKKDGVNGTVTSTKPLNYDGQMIEDFSLTFKDGRITEIRAAKGQKVLEKLVETDEGSHYLGEVALVPHDSPISNLGFIFSETLFDENASNHIAIGQAYPTCLRGGEGMSEVELVQHGANMSLEHVDFMIGSGQMDIDAVTRDGKVVPLFRNGNWA